MGQRSSGGVADAVRDGIARVVSAPAVFGGTLALVILFSLSPPLFAPNVAFAQFAAVAALSPFGGSALAPQGVLWLIIWPFLAGGILDRIARNRPTRGRGFFGACGAHFPAMLRLAVIEWLIWFAAAGSILDWRGYAGRQENAGVGVGAVLTLAIGLLFLYARVRLVVEDRRSALGALLAGGRFIRRNPAAVVIFLIFAAGTGAGLWLSTELAPFAVSEIIITVLLFLILASWAAATSLFQARLAHASYTAGPPLEWPESPSAEAITNLSSSSTP